MSNSRQEPAAIDTETPRLLHPLWCLAIDDHPISGGQPHGDEDKHRGAPTCWEIEDVRFSLCRFRWDDGPRYAGQRQAVDADGDPAAEKPEAERVELTLTDLGDGNEVRVPLDASELRLLIVLVQQQLDRLESGFGTCGRDFTHDLKAANDWN